MEFRGGSRRPRGGCSGGNNGQGHLSCVAAIPFAHNGSRGWRKGVGVASGGFLLSPSPPFRGHFCLSQWAFCALAAFFFFFFCQRLTLPACSFFCLLFLRPPPQLLSARKQKQIQKKKKPTVETATIHLLRSRLPIDAPRIQYGRPLVSVAHLAPRKQSAILKRLPKH